MIDVGPVSASLPDLLRLLAVPIFVWAAIRDVRTRRIPSVTWVPLVVLGLALLAWEGWAALDAGGFEQQLFVTRAVVSLGIVAPMGYLLWRLGGFGGADAKAVVTLAVLFPTAPIYFFPGTVLPIAPSPLGTLSLSILSNAVVVGACYPVALLIRNLLAGRFSPLAAVGQPVEWDELDRLYGRLLETPDGPTRSGLDLDALRMYLRWRELSLADLRADPERYRTTVPVTPADPGGGTVDGGVDSVERMEPVHRRPIGEDGPDDPWGAAAFLADADGAYGTTPDELRDGLRIVTSRDVLWVSPGMPFVVPLCLGLVLALTYGDLLYALLVTIGLA